MADNIKIKNIYYMLSYAFQTLRETGLDNVASEDFDNIHDLFAAILVRGVGTQVKRGLHRDYLQCEEILAGVRGQIRVSETIKQTQAQGRLVCAYDEFVPDSPHNRALKSVMLLLLRHGNVKPENKKALRKLLTYFSEVTEIAPAVIRWDALKYHRNNVSYRMLMGICRLTVKGLLLTTEKGTHRLATWFQDEAMHRLYEKFVLAYYVRHHSNFQPKPASIDWDISDEARNPYLPRMKSDITLQNGEKRLIIDAKWYERTMQENRGKKTYKSEHLYQIYAYVKNSDKSATGNVAGVLLYARTDESITPDADMTIGGNRISLKTLDLNCDWKAITAQLDNLCGWLS
ncbi:MAG: 5-methylcytosine-specific restriction endonuclease system specificity protein McrC [Helicobacteraceae bacterium]|jgi:5-methylcytosine-specific restriction enzyme subunit McrC|nr:5-methylcytosine-specific restriction endonuclease system specificity protein McrC [Helicobacteraceae bacterium]